METEGMKVVDWICFSFGEVEANLLSSLFLSLSLLQ